ncbi:unnamed protein product [Cylicocyclus nassatus]|uniref:5'-AMP-activated protein kinase subunit beta-1 n=1 Tax=Cylicocyclus nassatus TaxID=53992 RepID=A0AA36GUX9_CYLNA|nr:unnamed protein product [Cylicocyclus nassatus]
MNSATAAAIWYDSFNFLMSSSGQQEVLTASQGPNATTEGDSFLDRAYEYGGNVLNWIKYILKWSLVCEESRQREQTQMEKIIGTESDPTAPSDLQPVTETVMFDSATIMATLIITFCVFYFIDFFVQIFAGISGADISPSLASIPPVIPTRPRRRKKGSSLSRESRETTVSTQSTLSRPDTTQSSESGSAAVPMKEILTKSFKSSKEPISAKREKSSKENTPSKSGKVTSDRKLAGRSPLKHIREIGIESTLREEKDCDQRYGFDGDQVPCNCGRLSRVFTTKDEETQTDCDVVTAENYSNTDGASSIHTHYCTHNLKGYKRRTRDYVYDEDHGLPYADDLSGEEFGIYQYDKFKVRLGYEAQLEELRTEFSIDDASEQEKAVDEWECREPETVYAAPPPNPRHSLEVSMSEDELDSLYKTAENIFRKVAAHSHERGHNDNANGEGSKEEENCAVDIAESAKNIIDGVELIANPPTRILSSTDCRELGDGGAFADEIVEHALNNEATGDESFHIDDFDANENNAEPDWEEPRDLDLSGSQDYRERSEAFLRNENTRLHECDSKTARSLSVFDVRQSMKLRRFHHVLFSYPDKHAEKVLLTGSFFGWKLSMPMQREGDIFRLSITLPAGEHKYRFQVFRRK